MAEERKEAPEGIVDYSFSGTIINNNLNIWNNPNIDIKTKVNNGTILSLNDNTFIDFTDLYGDLYPNREKIVLSKSLIETLDLLSEGQIEGLCSGEYINSGNYGETGWRTSVFSGFSVPTGTGANGISYENSRWLRSIYYNETPVLSDKAQFNFQSVDIAFTPGYPNGDNLQTLTLEETTSRGISERLREGTENQKIYRILNKNCKGIIVNVKIPSLSRTDDKTGSIGRAKIAWQVSYRPIFSKITKQSEFSNPITETVFGKITTAGGYIRSTRVDFDISSTFSKEEVTISTTSSKPQTQTVINKKNIGNFLDNSDFIGWEIKVLRTTKDSVISLLTNTSYIDSITELYGSQFSYPNSAIVKNLFNAEFFSSVPERAFECNLMKVQIPGNYNPITRTYATDGYATTNGYWNGQYATGKHYTNNPVWCFNDLLTNKRYGLGKYISDISIDKFTLYKIGQYCDELVYDENGGLEPRFTCNTWIAGREDAFNVINDLASVFRGMVYYAQGNIYSVCDQPKTPRVIFTNSNVENGDFNYSSTSKRARQSIAIVRYNDPVNFYKPAIEYIEDVDAIRKYGIREIDLTAFACTSRGQAIRLGRWTLLTNNNENETITFAAGLQGTELRPGDVFKVHDFNRKLKRYGGRIWNITNSGYGDVITLDSTVPIESGVEYKLSVLTPSYYYDNTQVTDLNAGDFPSVRRSFLQDFIFSGQSGYNSNSQTIINLNQSLNRTDYNISGYPVWSIELAPNSTSYSGSRYFLNSESDYYRVLNIKESEPTKYEIVGIKYWEQKFKEIDSGINFQRPSISNTNKTPASPSNLSLDLYDSNGRDVIYYTFLMNNFNYVNNYRVYATTGSFPIGLPDNSNLIQTLPVDVVQSKYFPIESGAYNFRVYAYNEVDNIYSPNYASSSIDINKDIPITNVIISSLQLIPQ